MGENMVPRSPGYVSVGSRRYNEWQTLAFKATTEQKSEESEEETGPLLDHSTYPTPKAILSRTRKDHENNCVEVEKVTMQIANLKCEIYQSSDPTNPAICRSGKTKLESTEDANMVERPVRISAIKEVTVSVQTQVTGDVWWSWYHKKLM